MIIHLLITRPYTDNDPVYIACTKLVDAKAAAQKAAALWGATLTWARHPVVNPGELEELVAADIFNDGGDHIFTIKTLEVL